MKKPLRIAITTGDVDGIGTEIAGKALAKIGPQTGVLFFLWRSPRCPAKHLERLDRGFHRVTVGSWHEALELQLKLQPTTKRRLVDINSNQPPPLWVETSAEASHFGHLDGMVTAPLSKTAIVAAGLSDMGHTGILKRVSRSKDLYMGFVGDKFNICLATGHVPIGEVESEITELRLTEAARAADQLRRVLDRKQARRPLALLGLNPHAGEAGLIGTTEGKVHTRVLERLRVENIEIEGPLVPDAAFFKENWQRYSVYVANYHDQGLIPFKMVHGQESGVHITLGLPFVRTSVDHGTAKDIFGKNRADARSMSLAIQWAIRLCRSKADLTIKRGG